MVGDSRSFFTLYRAVLACSMTVCHFDPAGELLQSSGGGDDLEIEGRAALDAARCTLVCSGAGTPPPRCSVPRFCAALEQFLLLLSQALVSSAGAANPMGAALGAAGGCRSRRRRRLPCPALRHSRGVLHRGRRAGDAAAGAGCGRPAAARALGAPTPRPGAAAAAAAAGSGVLRGRRRGPFAHARRRARGCAMPCPADFAT